MKRSSGAIVVIVTLCVVLCSIALYVRSKRLNLERDLDRVDRRQRQDSIPRRATPPQMRRSEDRRVVSAFSLAAAHPERRGYTRDELAQKDLRLPKLFSADLRARFTDRYGFLVQKLALGNEESERFYAILEDGVERFLEVGAVAISQGLAVDDPGVKRLREEENHRTQVRLAELLGRERYEDYNNFERTDAICGIVDTFAVQAARGDPLTDVQASHLIRALAAASPSYVAGGRADASEIDWSAVDEAAQGVLSPQQLAIWKRGLAKAPNGMSRAEMELVKKIELARKRESRK